MPLTRLKLSAIADGGITTAELLDGTVATADIADGAVTGAKIGDGEVSLAKLSATGTKDSTTFLRGDNTFQVVDSLNNIDGGNASSVYTVTELQIDGGTA